jgi:hypothetical protein
MKASLAPRDAAGVAAFTHLMDALGWRAPDVARYLEVSERTVRRWLAQDGAPPRAAVIALWFESHYGRQAVAGRYMTEAQNWRAAADAYKAQNDALRAALARASSATHGAANESLYGLTAAFPAAAAASAATSRCAPPPGHARTRATPSTPLRRP